MKIFILYIALVGTLAAQELRPHTWTRDTLPPPDHHVWEISIAAMVAGSVADAKTSWGLHELNPVLRGADGRFGMRAVEIKAAVTGGIHRADAEDVGVFGDG